MQTLHPIESLGVNKVLAGAIRVERLSDRLQPRVPFPHRHDFFQVLLISGGRGWHEIDFDRHPVSANRVFVMKPGQVHSWNLDPRTKGMVIEFTNESLVTDAHRLPDWLGRLAASPDALVLESRDDFRDLLALCGIMRKEFEARRPHFEAFLQAGLTACLIRILRAGRVEPSLTGPENVVFRFKKLLEKNFTKHHDVAFYAEKLGMTPKALTMRLTRALDKAPRALIQERCLLESKRLLAYSGLSVAEVGYEVGFEDPNYFSRFFRARTKTTPAVFREKVRTLD